MRFMSPQLRLLYQAAWETFEDAGYYPSQMPEAIGLFVGGSDDFAWYEEKILKEPRFSDVYQAFTYSTNHFLATRLAYALDIRGPVCTGLAGCSTGLVTAHLAVQSLRLGECRLALAGGVTVELPNEGGYQYHDGLMFSSDGHCRPFDKAASGTVFSNGLGLVMLKRLDDAIADQDQIYGVIKGSAINNDGSSKQAFTAPSVDGQAAVIRKALCDANVRPETITYVEAHGTGTELGDPIEVASLTQAFGSDSSMSCQLGSVKGHVGHTDTAAGIVGLIKLALCFKHQYLPGTLHYSSPNPAIDFSQTPFSVTSQGQAWVSRHDGPLRAGVNAFGVGGTNAHMVLEEYSRGIIPPDEGPQLLTLSAKTPAALNKMIDSMRAHCLNDDRLCWRDVAWTLQVGRAPCRYRHTILAPLDDEKNTAKWFERSSQIVPARAGTERDIFFLFSGQGSQYQGMARRLYRAENGGIGAIFKEHMDAVLAHVDEDSRATWMGILYGNAPAERINETQYSQPILFCITYALSQLCLSMGLRPTALIGHSIGELAAATMAGVFRLSDAVHIVQQRGLLMQAQQAGSLCTVAQPPEAVAPYLHEALWVALHNTTNACVVGGGVEAVAAFEASMTSKGWAARVIKTSHAFHTPMMARAAADFEALLADYTLSLPQWPILSNVTGTWLTDEQARDPAYWAQHIVSPVQFSDSLSRLLDNPHGVYLEVGPSNTLVNCIKSHDRASSQHAYIGLLPHPKQRVHDDEYLLAQVGRIWEAGVAIDWAAIPSNAARFRVSLPTYAFDLAHYPIHLSGASEQTASASPEALDRVCQHIVSPNHDQSTLESAVLASYIEIFGDSNIRLDDDFFQLGGDSLKAVSLSAALSARVGYQVDVKLIFMETSPAALAVALRSRQAEVDMPGLPPLLVSQEASYYACSSAQSRMYTLYLLDPDSTAYNLPSATWVRGELSVARLQSAIRRLMCRHESLRTQFSYQDDKLVQYVVEHPNEPCVFSRADQPLTHSVEKRLADFVRPFDLSQAPLFRMEFIAGPDEGAHLLLFDFHHIIADGTSAEVLANELNALLAGETLSPARPYRDFSQWQQTSAVQAHYNAQQAYWTSCFRDGVPLLDVPTDYPRTKIKSFAGARHYFSMDAELSDAFFQFMKDRGITPFMALIGIWALLLSRYTGQNEMVIGAPVAGRPLRETQAIVGMFVNMLPMRCHVPSDVSFHEYVEAVKSSVLAAFDHQDIQFDALVSHLSAPRALNRNALLDVCFDYQNMEMHPLAAKDISFESIQVDAKVTIYDLLLTCYQDESARLSGFIEYPTALFSAQTIGCLVGQLEALIVAMINHPDQLISMIRLSENPEPLRLVQPAMTDQREWTDVANMLARAAKAEPDHLALILQGGVSYTFSDVLTRVEQMAAIFHQQGVGQGDIVAVMLAREVSLVVALFAILRVGACYVPIDAALPSQRVCRMLLTSGAGFILNDVPVDECPPSIRRLSMVPESIGPGIMPEHDGHIPLDSLANIIFTSGSTGAPKGVSVSQIALLNFIHNADGAEWLSREEDLRVLSVTTMSFDIFGFELITSLCLGKAVYLASVEESLDPVLLARCITHHRLTHIVSSVSRIKAFAYHPSFKPALKQLRVIMCGGEAMSIPLFEHLKAECTADIFNMYGPTEATIWCSVKRLTDADQITIGAPLQNMYFYVVNEAGQEQPVGAYGELLIAGDGLATGYQQAPEETEQRFVYYPHLTGRRLYRTGDRARQLANGEYALSGRLDAQVKVRGYRVELSEIESVACQHALVEQAVAILVTPDAAGGLPEIVLYYTPSSVKDSSITLFDWLQSYLPDYMCPSHRIRLKALPLTQNGKLDYAHLPMPASCQSDNLGCRETKTVSEQQQGLIAIWSEVLNQQTVGLQDNFFDLGGNSLGLITVSTRLHQWLGREIPLVKLFEHPTIARLAEYLFGEDTFPHAEPVIQPSPPPVTEEAIAVIGISCRYPGASDPDTFWHNLCEGVVSTRHFTPEELQESGIDPSVYEQANYIPAKGYLENAGYFDASFFGYDADKAKRMDPQARLLHTCAWEVLENAAYDPATYSGRIGLYAGSSSNVLWLSQQFNDRTDMVDAYERITLNEKDFLTSRVSYQLNLTGPSITVQTACSTSLVAIHQAVRSLQHGESDMAIAGGVSLSFPRIEGYHWQKGMIFSEDGCCRPFDQDSSGTVSGEGAGLVLLKRLSQAQAEGDHIYAVIKGSAVNNDGTLKVGYTAPSLAGQAAVIRAALAHAKLSPDHIDLLEAHGTGTPLGDPIEISAIKAAWNTDAQGYCALSAVKANLGHLDAAAGVTGFIKAVLCAYHRKIPPQVNLTVPRQSLALEESPFYINRSLQALPATHAVMRAAVSAFGIGGTNAHVIIESVEQPALSPPHSTELLVFSAKTPTALRGLIKKYIDIVARGEPLPLADWASTLRVGRAAFPWRQFLVVDTGPSIDLLAGFQACLMAVEDRPSVTASSPVVNMCYSPEVLVQWALDALFSDAVDMFYGGFRENMSVVFEEFGCVFDLQGIARWAQSAATEREAAPYSVPILFGAYFCLFSFVKTVLSAPVQVASLNAIAKQAWALVEDPEVSWQDTVLAIQAADREALIAVCSEEVSPEAGDSLSLEGWVVRQSGESIIVAWQQWVGTLWAQGRMIDWQPFYKGQSYRRIPLPTYAFDYDVYPADILPETGASDAVRLVGHASREERIRLGRAMWEALFGVEHIADDDDFFLLGGDSLKALSLVNKVAKTFHVNIAVTDVFEHTTFHSFMAFLTSANQERSLYAIPPAPLAEDYPASAAQQRLYAVAHQQPEDLSYHLGAGFELRGQISMDRLDSVFQTLVDRHDAFRTSFHWISGELRQKIADSLDFKMTRIDGKGQPQSDLLSACLRPFSLTEAPLLRVTLIEHAMDAYLLHIDMHHIIADQASIQTLVREIQCLYAGVSLAPLSCQYKDYAVWQTEYRKTDAYASHCQYWLSQLADLPERQRIGCRAAQAAVDPRRATEVCFTLAPRLEEKINALSKAQRVTPYTSFMAVFYILIWWHTGEEDVVVGTAALGRPNASFDDVVGMFVDTLAMRCPVDPSRSMVDLVSDVQAQLMDGFTHQHAQFDEIVASLGRSVGADQPALFDWVFNYIDMGDHTLHLDALSILPIPTTREAKFDLTLTVIKTAGHYEVSMEYRDALFTPDRQVALTDSWLAVLEACCEQETAPLSTYPFLLTTPLINEARNPAMEQPLYRQFLSQVARYPDRPALYWRGESITYAQLLDAVNQWVDELAEYSLPPQSRIALCLANGPAQVIALLAVLAIRGIYVPIDMDQPRERITALIQDVAPSVLLVDESSNEKALATEIVTHQVPALEPFEKRQRVNPVVGAIVDHAVSDTACILYTSGSTGRPKGVIVGQAGITRIVKEAHHFSITPNDVLLQLSNYAFDGASFDLYGALLNGAALVLTDKKSVLDFPALASVMDDYRVTGFYSNVALFNAMIDCHLRLPTSLRFVVMGGEAVSVHHVSRARNQRPDLTLINGYGPTETTIFATFFPMHTCFDDLHVMPIGRPVMSTQLRVVNSAGYPVPMGATGELLIAGDGVSQGYLHLPTVTADRFMFLPHEPDIRYYQTGDVVHCLPSGDLVYEGRQDNQVKIRGHRVELAEVEHVLGEIPGVTAACVVVDDHDDRGITLYGFYQGGVELPLDEQQIMATLRKRLPHYMLPRGVKRLTRWPLNKNHKVDRSALLDWVDSALIVPSCEVGDPLLESVRDAMQEVLGVSGMHVDDSFFDHGGHSIRAIHLVDVLGKRNITITVTDLFQCPTPRGLAEVARVKHASLPSADVSQGHLTLSASKIKGILAQLMANFSVFEAMLLSSETTTTLPLTATARFHLLRPVVMTGMARKTRLFESPLRVVTAILKTLEAHPLLHSQLDLTDACWRVYPVTELLPHMADQLPVIRLMPYTIAAREELIQAVYATIFRDIQRGEGLPWRACCLMHSDTEYELVWAFDHLLFDATSADVLMNTFERSGRPSTGLCYQSYAEQLLIGPQGIKDRELMDLFHLTEWRAASDQLMRALGGAPDSPVETIMLSIPIESVTIEDKVDVAWQVVSAIVGEYIGLTALPALLVHRARAYSGATFYQVVGECLDIIPYYACQQAPFSPGDRLSCCALHNLHFVTLLLTPTIAALYPETVAALFPAYSVAGGMLKGVLFNYQGELPRETVCALASLQEADPLAAVQAAAYHDEQSMHITLQSVFGFDVTRIKRICEHVVAYEHLVEFYTKEKIHA